MTQWSFAAVIEVSATEKIMSGQPDNIKLPCSCSEERRVAEVARGSLPDYVDTDYLMILTQDFDREGIHEF